jgi:hypothetical protein
MSKRKKFFMKGVLECENKLSKARNNRIGPGNNLFTTEVCTMVLSNLD